MIHIGENIKRCRELQNISREHMASELDMSLSGYSKIERSEDINLSRLYQIADILGVDISQILKFDASQVFNISNNNLVQGIGAKADHIHFSGDDYAKKYVAMLEQENERLKGLLGKKK